MTYHVCGKTIAALTTFVVIGCGVKHRAESDPVVDDALDTKVVVYRELIKTRQDNDGFVDTYQCNSLQRSGLAAAAGLPVRLSAAEEPVHPGRFFRRPTTYAECFGAKESRSTISPDDLLGLFWGAHTTRDLALLERVWAYGSSRTWFMGDDDAGGVHTLLKPRQVALLAAVIHKLGGKDHVERRYHAPGYAQCQGYECALQVYEITLRGEVEGGLTNAERGALKQAADRQRENPLTQAAYHLYTDGEQSIARDLLLRLPRYPADHLPASADVCDPWPVQRDDDDASLSPCPSEHRTHSGGDFLFTYRLITQGVSHGWY